MRYLKTFEGKIHRKIHRKVGDLVKHRNNELIILQIIEVDLDDTYMPYKVETVYISNYKGDVWIGENDILDLTKKEYEDARLALDAKKYNL